jgi:hypothetical protein
VIGACRPGQVSLHARNRSEISYGDIDTVIGEDESGVGGCELGGRHCDVVRERCGVYSRMLFATKVELVASAASKLSEGDCDR